MTDHPIGVMVASLRSAMLAAMGTTGIMRMGPPPDAPPAPIPAGTVMGWTLVLSSMFWPRVVFLGFWIFSRQIGDAFDHWIVPAIGFVLAPWTTVAYAIMWGISSDKVAGAEWIVVAVALVLDLATWAGARHLARS